ncbi:MAG: inner-membrane translocator [Chloroflexota bacterium]|nr:inner-membrane translocator [Chloroflexota bacterium]
MSEIKNPEAGTPVNSGQSMTTASVEVPSYLPRQTFTQLLRNDLGFIPVLLTLIVIMIFFAITTNGLFVRPDNLTNLVLQIATTGIEALGVTLVLLLGEIDLSVAAVGTLSAVLMGVLAERAHLPGWEAVLIGLLTGAAAGLLNGVFVALIRVPSFIVTLAASIAYSGLLLYLLSNQSTLIVRDPFILSFAGSNNPYLPSLYGIGLPTLVLLIYVGALLFDQVRRRQAGLRTKPMLQLLTQIIVAVVLVEGAVLLFEENGTGVPNTTAILFGLILLFWLILTKTAFGRHVYAVGGSAEAARRAGINVTVIRIVLFTLCSLLAAVGGILSASRGLSVQSQIPPTLLLDAIGAAVIGGVSLFGGRGSVWSIVLGVLIIGSLENGLDLKSQGSDVKQMIEGAVLLFAVTVDALVRRAQARSGR